MKKPLSKLLNLVYTELKHNKNRYFTYIISIIQIGDTMNLEQIEAFLAVVEHGSITSAANFLFIAQSNVSSRIKKLEESLEVSLLSRKKGYKNIALTPHGEAFLPLATQMVSLLEEANNLKNLVPTVELKIASVDAVNNYTFVPLYQEFMKKEQKVKLKISTHHSNEIHALVESGQADIGFVYSQLKYPDVISKPIFRELNYVVCHKDSPYFNGMEPNQLDLSKEIFLNWSHDFYQWHYHFFGDNPEKLISLNTGSLIAHYLDSPGNWAIAPMSVIESFKANPNIVYYSLSSPPPPRICYQITKRTSNFKKNQVIERFEEYTKAYIESDKSICTFQTWMMN